MAMEGAIITVSILLGAFTVNVIPGLNLRAAKERNAEVTLKIIMIIIKHRLSQNPTWFLLLSLWMKS